MKKFLFLMMAVFMTSSLNMFSQTVSAAEYQIKQMTPEVERALQSRKGRFGQLESYKSQGAIGENNRGYVEALAGDDAAKDVVSQENADRQIIYQTIAEQNGLSDQIDIIEKVFAQVQSDKAQSGYKIQNEEGNWVTK